MNIRSLALALCLGIPAGAHASGFSLIEANADGQGAAYAGSGAKGDNASTIFFNPAAMTRLPGRQIVASLHAIGISAKFDDGNPATHDGGDAGGLSVLPNLYYAMPINANVWFGLGINVPFGLKTEYDANWVGRVQGIKSEMKTVNINPALAWRVNDRLSLGAGLNAMYIEAELTSFAGAAGTLTVKGDDWGYGYNVGLLYEAGRDTRVGVSYRSRVKQHLTGDISFSSAPTLNSGGSADITLPDTWTLSLYHRLSPRWALLADLARTGWSSFQELRVVRSNGAVLGVTPENWKNTFRYSLGAHYQLTERTTLRMGIGYDETPVPDARHRTVRIPDNDRTWLAAGIGFRLNSHDVLDVAYSHLFVKDAPIDNGVTGRYQSHVDILGLQYTHTF